MSLARALVTDPRLLICDEPVSALDACNRNHVLRLLDQLRDELGLPIVVISHDLSSLAGIADRVAVLYRGRIVEDGPVGQVFTAPAPPLHGAADRVGAERQARPAAAPHQLRRTAADPEPPSAAGACVFAARCPFAIDACAVQPRLEPVRAGDRRTVACHRHVEWPALAELRRRPAHSTAPASSSRSTGRTAPCPSSSSA